MLSRASNNPSPRIIYTLVAFIALSAFCSPLMAQTQSPEEYLRQAAEAEKRNDYAGAEKIYLEAAKADPNDERALYQLVRFLKSATLQAIDHLSNLDQNSVYILELRAESHTDQEKYPEAIYEYKEVIAKEPDFPGVHFGLGEAYYLNVNYPKAEKELRLALAEDPNLP